MEPDPVTTRPRWRGRLHTYAFAAAVPASALLLVRASHPAALVAGAIYATGLLAVFGVSAAYHRLARTSRTVEIMRRLDHAMIYVLIAGTYTPVCLLALPRSWGIPVLAVVWAGAAAGIAMKVFAFHRPAWKVASWALYPVLGWTAIAAGPVMVRNLTTAQLVLIVAGGVLYTAGFPVLLRRRPDPSPRVFGYHEVWHAFTVAAGACHYAAVTLLVASAR